MRQWYKFINMALQIDKTKLFTMHKDGVNVVGLATVTLGTARLTYIVPEQNRLLEDSELTEIQAHIIQACEKWCKIYKYNLMPF